jgi:alpha-aminoadipic semialdehyde synthase
VSGRKSGDQIDQTLERAKIVNEGIITSEHSWLAPRVEGWRNTQGGSSRATPSSSDQSTTTSLMREKKKKVLLLGSGLVAGPAVDVFVSRGDVELVIGRSPLGHSPNRADDQQVTIYPKRRLSLETEVM